jgi:hypothetical protein
MAIRKATLKRFTPGNGGFPLCGRGKESQISVPDPPKPPKAATLFHMPHSGSSFPELVALTKRLNAVFSRDAWRCLSQKRELIREKTLEITFAFDRGRLYLTYAIPVRKPRRAARTARARK